MKKRGFVTFTNNNEKYVKLHNVLLESVLTFTDLDVEVNSINFDYKHSNPRVISKRINLQQETPDTIFYAKQYACYTADFEIGMHLDSDMIVTPGIVKLFDFIPEDYEYVKAPRHPWDGPLQEPHEYIMRCLGAKEKTQPYVHASSYLFTKNGKNFLKEVYETGMNLFSRGISPINYDETVLNVLLWKNGVRDGYLDCFDIYFEYFNKKLELKENYNEPYSNIPDFKLNYYSSHGCKNYEDAKNIFENFKKIYIKEEK